jgi:hypothetical protein
MPDGGSDCCANCVFNRLWGSYDDPEREGNRAFGADCVLRGVQPRTPYWTYCDWFLGYSLAARPNPFSGEARNLINRRPSSFRLDEDGVAQLVGRVLAYLAEKKESFPPVMADGLGSRHNYSRIPWDGPNEPSKAWTEGTCNECSSISEPTIHISPPDLGSTLAFCSDSCYLAWWRTRHPDPPDWDGGPRVVAGHP